MKKNLLFFAFFACMSVSAQEAGQKRELVEDSYDRNSLSIVVIDRGDGSDKLVYDAVQEINFGDKFDRNDISIKRIMLSKNRDNALEAGDLDKPISEKNFGFEVIKYWFDSDDDGIMSGSLVESRGRFNATDEEVLTAKSSEIGESALKDAGYSLINSSYIVLLDYSQFKSETSEYKEVLTGKTKTRVTESLVLKANVYKIDFSESQQNEFYSLCWIDEDTPADEVAAHKAAFAKMNFRIVPVASVTVSSSADVEDGGTATAVKSAYAGAIRNLESKISSWQVITAVKAVKPIRAKIGTKEGLKNTHRYTAYIATNKTINGEEVLYSKKSGYVRATKIAENNSNATGESPMSEFYQISRVKNIEAGELLKQSNDLGMGVMAGYSVGGLSPFNVSLDYLMNISTNGSSSYLLMDFGYDAISSSDCASFSSNSLYSEGLSFLNGSLGVGYGLRFTRFVEVMPYAMAGADYVQFNSEDFDEDEEESGDEMMAKMAYLGKVGVKANITVAYPLQVVAGVNYSLIVSEGDVYNTTNTLLKGVDKERKGGLAFTVGVKWIF